MANVTKPKYQPLHHHHSIITLGGRRFLLTVGMGLLSTVLLLAGKVPPEIWRDVIIATVAAYIVGNTYQKVKGVEG